MAAEKHALLSASSAERWLNCPPSARLTESMPETTSDYAEEGRVAHALGELHLTKAYTTPMGPKKFGMALKKLKANPRYAPEMDRHVETYTDYIEHLVLEFSERPYVAVEVQVDFSEYAPGGFGTSDCIIIGSTAMHVIDFKYGQGVPVSPEQNPQMMLYALGALNKYAAFYPINQVILHVCQPRLNSLMAWATSAGDLLAWGDSIKPTAELAHSGGGAFTPGDHCRFCKARATCEARTNPASLDAVGTDKPPLVDNAELARRILAIRPFVAILKDLEEYALSECLLGNEVPGFKAVEGRSNRAFTDVEDAIKAAVAAGWDKALFYQTVPHTLTDIEKKVMGTATFNEVMGSFIIKPPGKPALAPDTDKRPAIGRVSAEQDFEEVS